MSLWQDHQLLGFCSFFGGEMGCSEPPWGDEQMLVYYYVLSVEGRAINKQGSHKLNRVFSEDYPADVNLKLAKWGGLRINP
jgi:hypothetical protein